MRSQFLSLLGIAASVALLSTSAPMEAEAANINTHGSICQNYNASEVADIDYLTSGVRNIATSARSVICSVPRSPLPAGAISGAFYVDFTLAPNTSISCTLYSFDDNTDDMLGFTQLFQSNPSTSYVDYDILLSLPVINLPTFSYTALLCSLPNNSSTLRGVTSVQ